MKPAEPEEEIIDTSSKPKVEEAAEKEETPTEGTQNVVKLSAEEEAELNKIIDEIYEKRMADIYAEIIKKAEFLIKMQVPESMVAKDESGSEFQLLKAPSYFAALENISTEQREKLMQEDYAESDWKVRLQQWRTNQQSQGAIKDFTEVRKDIFDSSNMSVLAIL